MKQFLTVLFVFVLALVPCATLVADDSPVEVSASLGVMSKYLGSAGAVYEDGPVIQPGILMEHQSGLYANLWSSVGFEDDVGDEFDYIVGWSGNVGQGFSANVGFGYWDFSKMFHDRNDNVWNVFAELSYPLDGDSAVLYTKSDGCFMEPDSSFEGGFAHYLGVRFYSKTPFDSSTADLSLAYDDGLFGSEPAFSLQCRLGIDSNISDSLSIGPRLALSVPLDPEEKDSREFEFVWGVGMSYTF